VFFLLKCEFLVHSPMSIENRAIRNVLLMKCGRDLHLKLITDCDKLS